MFNWGGFTLLLYIIMRISGLVLFSPILGRNGVPSYFRTGLILVLSFSVYAATGQEVTPPVTLLELSVRLVSEMSVGFALGMVTRLFFYIPEQAGEILDTQMGMSMARSYDPGSQSNITVTANLLNLLMTLLFFAANGHLTLMRLIFTSGEVIPFGAAAPGPLAAERVIELFTECVLLSVKLSLPILGAELLGQVGMGVLMKAIPQINVFAINIELKVIVGMVMLLLLIQPMSEFLLETESLMLGAMRDILPLMAGS